MPTLEVATLQQSLASVEAELANSDTKRVELERSLETLRTIIRGRDLEIRNLRSEHASALRDATSKEERRAFDRYVCAGLRAGRDVAILVEDAQAAIEARREFFGASEAEEASDHE